MRKEIEQADQVEEIYDEKESGGREKGKDRQQGEIKGI